MGEKMTLSDTTTQPAPKPNDKPGVWGLVMQDMGERDAFGAAKYGTRLQPFNGRDALVDAYQEALDLVVYLRTAIYERDNPPAVKDDSGVMTFKTVKDWVKWAFNGNWIPENPRETACIAMNASNGKLRIEELYAAAMPADFGQQHQLNTAQKCGTCHTAHGSQDKCPAIDYSIDGGFTGRGGAMIHCPDCSADSCPCVSR